MGWKVVGDTNFPKKCVAIAAPHTSNWDFIYGRCYAYLLGIRPKYLAKSELFTPLFSSFLRLNGAIPVERKDRHNLVDSLVGLFLKKEDLILNLSPEGTRSKVDRWKTGFYYIALHAEVPIVLLGIDYKKKEIGIIDTLNPSGDFSKDILIIQNKFHGISARFPENFNSKFF